jgi:ubiquinone biosynthesis protein UbiJ
MKNNDSVSERLLLPQLTCAAIEWIINKAVSLNTNKVISFTRLHQKTLTIELAELSLPLAVTVNVTDNHPDITVTTQCEVSDCVITTSLKTLKKLSANESLTQLIKQDELDVQGDIKVAQHFAQIAQALDIDWQSELAKHLGDVPTHKLLQLGKQASQLLSAKSKQIEADISEYVVHEQRLVVTDSQITDFNQQVDELAQATDSLVLRLNKLCTIAGYSNAS